MATAGIVISTLILIVGEQYRARRDKRQIPAAGCHAQVPIIQINPLRSWHSILV